MLRKIVLTIFEERRGSVPYSDTIIERRREKNEEF